MKPRVMSLVLFTCMVGLLIAPFQVDFKSSVISLLAVAIGSGAAGVLNMWYESDLDALMSRTCLRPIPTGKIKKNQALYFGIVLSFVSITMLYYSANLISAILLASTIAFYFFIYTIWLKRKTSQNIVIGGAAGALPPVIGWTIATGSISIEPIILLLIIFIFVTLTLKIFSMLFFKFFLLAVSITLNTILFKDDKLVDFSVMTGPTIVSYKLILVI